MHDQDNTIQNMRGIDTNLYFSSSCSKHAVLSAQMFMGLIKWCNHILTTCKPLNVIHHILPDQYLHRKQLMPIFILHENFNNP